MFFNEFSFIQLEKRELDGYKPGRSIPCFAIKVEETSPRQCLVQKVSFAGVEEAEKYLSIGMDIFNHAMLVIDLASDSLTV